MIHPNMKFYSYYTLEKPNEYGQRLASNPVPAGTVKMCVFVSSQSVQDNINYKNCQYIGLTQDEIKDTYVIQYGDERLKVLYINTQGRYKQVFMAKM